MIEFTSFVQTRYRLVRPISSTPYVFVPILFSWYDDEIIVSQISKELQEKEKSMSCQKMNAAGLPFGSCSNVT